MSASTEGAPELHVGDRLTYYGGGTYKVLSFLLSASGYEKGDDLTPMTRYVQEYDGEMPAGTEYVRPTDEILYGTIVVEGLSRKIFEINITPDE